MTSRSARAAQNCCVPPVAFAPIADQPSGVPLYRAVERALLCALEEAR